MSSLRLRAACSSIIAFGVVIIMMSAVWRRLRLYDACASIIAFGVFIRMMIAVGVRLHATCVSIIAFALVIIKNERFMASAHYGCAPYA